jgi:hypothetical protein
VSSFTYIETKRSATAASIRLAQHLAHVVQDFGAEVAPGGVHAEREREAGLEQPPLTEVDGLDEPVALERELALVDEQPCLGPAGRDLVRDLVERKLAVPEVAEVEAERQERRRQRARDDDLPRAELVRRELLAGDHDRPVPGPDARPVREEHVVLLHERVRGERERGDLQPCRPSPLVQRLDVAEDLVELVPARVDAVLGERPVHERVVRVGAVTYADPHEAGHASACDRACALVGAEPVRPSLTGAAGSAIEEPALQ